MWKARKIELISNKEKAHKDTYFFDRYTLKINGVQIANFIGDNLNLPTYFQTWICNYCGYEGCSAGGFLSVRRHEKSLLFIPCFDYMEEYLEYDGCDENGDYGDSECPPHKWYEEGILEVDEETMPEFLGVLKGFDLNEIPFITKEEMNEVLDWEQLVKENPAKGFMRLERTV
jgi:hypothetical protein